MGSTSQLSYQGSVSKYVSSVLAEDFSNLQIDLLPRSVFFSFSSKRESPGSCAYSSSRS